MSGLMMDYLSCWISNRSFLMIYLVG